MAATLGALVGVVLLIAPPVAQQVQDLLTNLPRLSRQSRRQYQRPAPAHIRSSDGPRRSSRAAQPGVLASTMSEIFGFLRGAAVPYVKGGVEFLIEGVSVLVMALYSPAIPRSTSTGSSR